MALEDKEPEEDQIRKIAELRVNLEKRIRDLQTELQQLTSLLELINSTLIQKGFKKPEVPKIPTQPTVTQQPPASTAGEPQQAPQQPSERVPAIPFKTVTGELLANLYITEDSMRVITAPDKQFTVDTPPFMAFLVERVLAKMQEKDREAAASGEIQPDQILSYEIIQDGDILRELSIKNVGEDRARELKSTIRWTLEKMHEKIKSTT
jgi:hypothetical protein